jgi:uncharacterized protein (TIGR03437 family)
MVRHRLLLVPLALAICTGTVQATNLLVASPTIVSALKCDTNTGPSGSVTLKVTAASASATNIVNVTLTPPAGISAVVSSGSAALNSSSASVTYTVTTLAGCAGATSLGVNSYSLPFTTKIGASGGSGSPASDISYSASVTVSATGPTPLTATPNSVTIPCTANANGTFTPASAQNFSVTSSATGGNTPVTWDTSTVPAWLTVSQVSSSNLASSSTAIVFSAGVSSCSGTVGSSKTATVHMVDLPATTYQTVTVTLMIVGPADLTLSGNSTSGTAMALSYTKYQTTLASGTVTVYGPSVYFGIDTTTLPNWLTVNFTSGEATPSPAGFGLTFTVTKVADSMTPGAYGPVGIHLKVAGYADSVVYVGLTVLNTAPSLSVAEGVVRSLSWNIGQPLPTATITAVSSGAPIPYNVTISAGSPDAGATATPAAGLAYSFGTPIAITFNPLDFAGAQPGTTLTCTVTLNWTSGSTPETIPVAFTISVEAPSTTATLTGISPSNLPTATAGETFTVTLYGSGFVASQDPLQKTFVGLVSTGHLTADAYIASNVVSASSIILTITVPSGSTDPLSFASANTVVIGVCNPNGSTCSTATGTQSLAIDAGPIIQSGGVTSASTFVSVTPPNGTLAPYDIITIFGSNFCTSNGTGCGATQILYPTINNNVYGTTVSPDGGQRNLMVMVYPTGTTTGGWAAPLLFATNNQINAMVPGEITPGSKYDIVVKFGTLSSSTYTFTAAATDPGVFVVDSNNNGAVVLPTGYVANTAANAGRMRAVSTDSQYVSIFMTGLGVPNSTGSNATQNGTSTPWTNCIAPFSSSGTVGYAGAAGLTTLDGAVIQSALITPGMLTPCFNQGTYLTATVGGATALVVYAGWAPNAIAGLYQVNVQLPAYGASIYGMGSSSPLSSFTGPVQVPVEVFLTGPSTHSQTTVGMYVQPAQTVKLAGAPVSPVTLSSGVYQASVSALSSASSSNPVGLDQVLATGGTGPTYAVTGVTGSDSNGVAVLANFGVDTSGNVTIQRAFLAGTYSVTITVTDASTPTPYPTESITLIFTVS